AQDEVLIAHQVSTGRARAPGVREQRDRFAHPLGHVFDVAGRATPAKALKASLLVEGEDGGEHVAEVAHEEDLPRSWIQLAQHPTRARAQLLDEIPGACAAEELGGPLVETVDPALAEGGQLLDAVAAEPALHLLVDDAARKGRP